MSKLKRKKLNQHLCDVHLEVSWVRSISQTLEETPSPCQYSAGAGADKKCETKQNFTVLTTLQQWPSENKSLGDSQLLKFVYLFIYSFIYLFRKVGGRERERNRERVPAGGGVAEGRRTSQAGSSLSAQSPMQSLISWTKRSWSEWKSRVGRFADWAT